MAEPYYELEVAPGEFRRLTGDFTSRGSVIPFRLIPLASDEQLAVYGVVRREAEGLAPQTISRRQFYQQLAVEGVISQDEALWALSGQIPAVLISLVLQLPEADQFAAKMHLSGSATYERNHPLTAAIGAAQGKTSEQIDAFYQAAANL